MNTEDPDFETDYVAANAELVGYAYTMAEERRRCPADDIVTRLVQADIDGESMQDVEFAFFVILLAVAGNETTRNAMTHGMNAFFETPTRGSCSSVSGRRRRPTRSSVGPPLCTASSERRWRTTNSAGPPFARASASGCSTVRPTTTTRCSTSRSSSTSCAIPTRIWASAAT